MSDKELSNSEFDAKITEMGNQIDAATAAFETEVGGLALELDTNLAATDAALEDFVQEVEKGDA